MLNFKSIGRSNFKDFHAKVFPVEFYLFFVQLLLKKFWDD